jgi:hypothetical protein
VPDSDPLITARFSLVWSSAVDVAQITERIGLTPSTVWTRGETRVSPSGHRYPKPYERSGWQIAVAIALLNEIGAELDLDLYVVDETYDEPIGRD